MVGPQITHWVVTRPAHVHYTSLNTVQTQVPRVLSTGNVSIDTYAGVYGFLQQIADCFLQVLAGDHMERKLILNQSTLHSSYCRLETGFILSKRE